MELEYEQPQVEEISNNVAMPTTPSDLQDQVSHKEVPVMDSRELHEPNLSPRYLQYQQVGEVNGQPILSTEAANFPLSPNNKYLDKLEKMQEEDGSLTRAVKLLNVAGTDLALLNLIVKGITTGLSHGTMDIIYRIGVGDRVREVLDNIGIAVGSLQRRVIVSDLMSKIIVENDSKKVLSIAGGSCLLPIEGVYQSGKEGLVITNIDRSEKANVKAETTLANINTRLNRGLSLQFLQRDILQNGLGLSSSDGEPEIIECTGFWEYLEDQQRDMLLEKVAESMGSGDVFVLTALINNPQQRIFEAMKFKKLSSSNLEELLGKIGKHFSNIDKVVQTPNGTYATFVLRK